MLVLHSIIVYDAVHGSSLDPARELVALPRNP